KRLAADLERQSERQAAGLEPMPQDTRMTLAELCRWWLKEKCPPASQEIERQRIERHICTRPLGALPVPKGTTEAVEAALARLERESELAPASLNKLRTRLNTVFNKARKAKKWTGPNPIADVERRKVPKRAYATLRAEEVPVLLPHVEASWRPF